MIKSKSILLAVIVIMVMALVLPACAPAKPASITPSSSPPPSVTTPPTATTPTAPPVEIKTSYEGIVYADDTYGFYIKYPKSVVLEKPPLSTGIFSAKDANATVYIDVRPATSFKDAAVDMMADLIAAKGFNVDPKVDSDKITTLTDGKTTAYETMLSASVLFQPKIAYCYGILKDGKAIIVMTGLDPKNADLYKEIAHTFTLK